METHKVTIRRSALKSLKSLPRDTQEALLLAAEGLAEEPRPVGSKLKGHRHLHRIRVQDYRIIYEIQDAVLTILVIRIGHRREVYRGL